MSCGLRQRLEKLADDYAARLKGLQLTDMAQTERGDVLRYAYGGIERELRELLNPRKVDEDGY